MYGSVIPEITGIQNRRTFTVFRKHIGRAYIFISNIRIGAYRRTRNPAYGLTFRGVFPARFITVRFKSSFFKAVISPSHI